MARTLPTLECSDAQSGPLEPVLGSSLLDDMFNRSLEPITRIQL